MKKATFSPTRLDTVARTALKMVTTYEVFMPVLAKGNVAAIYYGKDSKTQSAVVLKAYPGKWAQDNHDKLTSELDNLREFGEMGFGPKLLAAAHRTANTLYIPLELFNCGSLDLNLQAGQVLPEPVLIRVATFLVNVMKQLHIRTLVHGSIQPRHILVHLDDKGGLNFKLIGFRYNSTYSIGKVSFPATAYTAPEARSATSFGPPSDIWAFGLTLYELATGVLPSVVHADFEARLQKGQALEFPAGAASLSEPFKKLVQQCLCLKPEQRLTAVQIGAHPFLIGLTPTSSPALPVPPAHSTPQTSAQKVLTEEEQVDLVQTNFAEFMRYLLRTEPKRQGKLAVIEKTTLDPYEDVKLLAQGGFSEIYTCKHKTTKCVYAMKVVKTNKMSDVKVAKLLLGEIEIMLDLKKSEFTIDLYEYFVYRNELRMILEFCNGGDLEDYVSKSYKSGKGPLSEEELQLVAFSIASGLKDMHAQKIMHRDIKPKNILLVVDDASRKITKVKLCDYGLSRNVADCVGCRASTILGTFDYFAPELYDLMQDTEQEDAKYDNKVDVWSYGVLLFYTAYAKTVLVTPNKKADVLKRGTLVFPKTPAIPPDYIDLIKACLVVDPTKRPSFEEILKHRFFGATELPTKPSNPHTLVQPLGKNGLYGSEVVLCNAKNAHKTVALNPGQMTTFRKKLGVEVNFLKQLNSPYVVKLHDAFYVNTTLHLDLEYIQGNNLERYVLDREHKGKPLTADEQGFIAARILLGLDALHRQGQTCERLAPQRILLALAPDQTAIKRVVLSDYGFAKLLLPQESLKTASETYTAPQFYFPDVYQPCPAWDMWSYGMVLFFLIYGVHPHLHPGHKKEEILTHGSEKIASPARPSANADLVALMKQCLNKTTKARPQNAKEVLDAATYLQRHLT